MPTFSIIVPVYNVAPYLRECLDSVLHQTFNDWECLCVNDGSTDESGAILDEYARKDKRFRVFHKPNGGVSSARNLALDHVRGEWIGFLDGDDVFNHEVMRVCHNITLQFSSIDMIRFKNVEFREDESCSWPSQPVITTLVDYGNELDVKLFEGGFGNRFYHFCKIKDIRFPHFILGEDWIWKIKVIERFSSCVDLENVFYGYRLRQTSAMHSRFTIEKILSEIYWKKEAWRILKCSKKTIKKNCLRFFEVFQIEQFSSVYFKLPKSMRKTIWDHWMKCLMELIQSSMVSRRLKYSSWLVCKTNSPFLAFLLFYLPYWIKVHTPRR